MVATIIIASCLALYLVGFVAYEIYRRKSGKGSVFTEDHCDCKVMNGRRLVAYYRKQKKAEARKGAR